MLNELGRASDALIQYQPTCLVMAGIGFNAAGGDFDTFDTWSAQSGNYNAADCRDTWRSFKPGRDIGAGSLFGMARDAGWTDGNASPRPAPAQSNLTEQPRNPAPGMAVAVVWGRCVAATSSHAYILAKGATGGRSICCGYSYIGFGWTSSSIQGHGERHMEDAGP